MPYNTENLKKDMAKFKSMRKCPPALICPPGCVCCPPSDMYPGGCVMYCYPPPLGPKRLPKNLPVCCRPPNGAIVCPGCPKNPAGAPPPCCGSANSSGPCPEGTCPPPPGPNPPCCGGAVPPPPPPCGGGAPPPFPPCGAPPPCGPFGCPPPRINLPSKAAMGIQQYAAALAPSTPKPEASAAPDGPASAPCAAPEPAEPCSGTTHKLRPRHAQGSASLGAAAAPPAVLGSRPRGRSPTRNPGAPSYLDRFHFDHDEVNRHVS